MVFQETITIPNNKARRILELCKSLGIELYDTYNNTIKKKIHQTSPQKINDYLVEYYQWSRLTKGHLKSLFLTPRILTEFDKKDVFGTSFQLNIQAHLDSVLAPQIYFIELIINEMKNYKYTDGKIQTTRQNVLQKIFTGPTKIKEN